MPPRALPANKARSNWRNYHDRVQTAITTNNNTGSGNQYNNNGEGQQTINNGPTTYNFTQSVVEWKGIADLGASHLAKQGFSECHEGTRESVCEEIRKWAADESGDQPICWLSGAAGIGKSSIALTVAASRQKADGLVCSYFFRGSDPNHTSVLVPTLALQLTMALPPLKLGIEQQIRDNRRLLKASSEIQFKELIANPTAANTFPHTGSPTLIIVDGLDQFTDRSALPTLLSTIASHRGPSSALRLLICSRPEPWIRRAFDSQLHATKHVVLSSKTPQADVDIEKFYRDRFSEADSSGCSLWLQPEYLDRLVAKSSGNFTYAEAVVNLVGRKDTHAPVQLDIFLSRITGNALPRFLLEDGHQPTLGQLDELYSFVGSAIRENKKLSSILAAIFILPPHVTPSPEVIEIVLCLERGEVNSVLHSMHSVLDIRGRNEKILAYHSSLEDFVFDEARSKDTSISRYEQENLLVRCWLKALIRISHGDERSERCRDPSFIRQLFTAWTKFCSCLPRPSKDLLNDLQMLNYSSLFLASVAVPASCFPPSVPSQGSSAPAKSRLKCHHDDIEEKRRQESIAWQWHEIFTSIPKWLHSCGGGSETIHHFRKETEHFHLTLPPGSCPTDEFIRWIILNTTNCEWSSPTTDRMDAQIRRHFGGTRPDPRSLVSQCICKPSGLKRRNSTSHRFYGNEFHVNIQAASLQTAQFLVSQMQQCVGDKRAGDLNLNALVANLLDSSLLHQCGYERRVITLCESFVFCAKKRVGVLPEATGRSTTRRTKLIQWLKGFPESYSREIERLKYEVHSLNLA